MRKNTCNYCNDKKVRISLLLVHATREMYRSATSCLTGCMAWKDPLCIVTFLGEADVSPCGISDSFAHRGARTLSNWALRLCACVWSQSNFRYTPLGLALCNCAMVVVTHTDDSGVVVSTYLGMARCCRAYLSGDVSIPGEYSHLLRI